MHKQNLRQQLLARRQQLTPNQHLAAQQACAIELGQHPWWQSAKHIGLYWAVGHELKLTTLIHSAYANHKHFHLPVVDPQQPGIMTFYPWTPGQPLQLNRFGINEPQQNTAQTATDALDLMIVPCLGLSLDGMRIGTGGGYYDRYLASARDHQITQKPRVIGIGFDVQQCDEIPTDPWDQPCDDILLIATQYNNSTPSG